MMMKKNRVNYKREMNQIIEQGANRHALFALVRDMVDNLGRDGGALAFNALNDALELPLNAPAEEVIYDVLDALSGQCNHTFWIGSGDYHVAPQAA